MKLIWSALIMLSLFAGAGCSSTKVTADQMKGKDFHAYKTYAWLPDVKDTTNKALINNDITYQNIREAADKEMLSRGYMMDSKNPDLLLQTQVIVKKNKKILKSRSLDGYDYAGSWPTSYYVGYYSIPSIDGYSITPITYTEGTVVIDVIEKDSKRLIWRGWSAEEIADYKHVDELYENVDKMFKKYPIKAKK